ncbi:MAG: ATP-dependent chaperone ClpB, partial [Geminicoccaceae bacterium]|nr:ATP-dependent chaperone ClpB [Geminicoccaceae bacterium]
MDFQNYTERARGFIQSAQGLALREGHQRFLPEHILKVLLDDPEGLASNLIQAAGGNPKAAAQATALLLAKQPKVEGSGAGQVYLAPETARLFESAEQVAKKAGDSFVTVERLLQALAMSATDAGKVLKDAGATAQGLNAAIDAVRQGRKAESASAEDSYEALKKYTRDLTAIAREGKLD